MVRLAAGFAVIALAMGIIGYALAAAGPAKDAAPAAKPDLKAGQPALGVGADMGGKRPFPADNPWNKDISKEPVDPNSDKLVASIGLGTALHPDFGTQYGIPYVVVPGTQPKVPVKFEYADESDPGPYPIPPDAPIEGGPKSDGDRHVLVIDRDNWRLYELYASYPQNGGKSWKAGSGAIFDLSANKLRPAGWTSCDAAGLPVFPGLVRYDETVLRKSIDHAIRFTCVKSRHAYVSPATHFASSSNDPNLPPMGMRARLKSTFDTSGYPPSARVILEALKKYGIILADNGSNWYITGAPDPRWNDEELNTLKKVKGRDFEVVKMGELVTK
jgi:hypothetical protein